jgi:hypothetical protein
MFTYLSNIALDIYYGYVEIKCVNPSCNRIFKMARNKLDSNITNHFSCNMGCALNYFKQTNKDDKEIVYYNYNNNNENMV